MAVADPVRVTAVVVPFTPEVGVGCGGGGGSISTGSLALTGQGALSTLKLNSGFQTQDNPQTNILPPKTRFRPTIGSKESGATGLQAVKSV